MTPEPRRTTPLTTLDPGPATGASEPARPGRTVLTTGAIAEIAGLAARTVPGVVTLCGSPDVPAGPAEVQDGRTEVSLALVAAYDVSLCDLAADVRHAVVDTVARMTGLEVTSVDVDVADVTDPRDRRAAAR